MSVCCSLGTNLSIQVNDWILAFLLFQYCYPPKNRYLRVFSPSHVFPLMVVSLLKSSLSVVQTVLLIKAPGWILDIWLSWRWIWEARAGISSGTIVRLPWSCTVSIWRTVSLTERQGCPVHHYHCSWNTKSKAEFRKYVKILLYERILTLVDLRKLFCS